MTTPTEFNFDLPGQVRKAPTPAPAVPPTLGPADFDPAAPETGLYLGIPDGVYRSVPYYSSSVLRAGPTLAHIHHAMTASREATKAMRIGNVVDSALDGMRGFPQRFAVAPECDRRTTAGKETWAAFVASVESKGLEVIPAKEYDTGMEIAAAALKDPRVKALASLPETTQAVCIWQDDQSGLWLKARLDHWVPRKNGLVVDYKTTRSPSARAFAHEVGKRGYHMQLAMYQWGIRATTNYDPGATIVAIPNVKPYEKCACLYSFKSGILEAGFAMVRKILMQVAEAKRTNIWPGYQTTTNMQPEVLDLPDYYLGDSYSIEYTLDEGEAF